MKVNAPEVLERELRGLRKDEVFLSSASDPYQPVEAKYRVTRRCLQVLASHQFPVSVLTRSPLVLRDLDILEELDWVKVGMSITSVPDRTFEPGVPPLERRIDTLRKLSRAGLTTFVSLAPVIPGIMKVDLDRLFQDLSEAGVSFVYFGILRFTGYEESRVMFEQAAQVSTPDALEGREEAVVRLSELVRRYGMEPIDDDSWKQDPARGASLDTFCS